MVKTELCARERFELSLADNADLSVHRIPATELLVGASDDSAAAVAAAAATAAWADSFLHDMGAEAVLLGRLGHEQRRLWRGSKIMLDAFLLNQSPLERPYPAGGLALLATRLTPTGMQARFGALTMVGQRARGNPYDVVPLGVSSDLAYAANSVAAARSMAMGLKG